MDALGEPTADELIQQARKMLKDVEGYIDAQRELHARYQVHTETGIKPVGVVEPSPKRYEELVARANLLREYISAKKAGVSQASAVPMIPKSNSSGISSQES